MQIKMEDGTRLTPKANTEIRCEEHGIVTTWGELSPIQQLAVEAGIDTMPDMPCLIGPEHR